MSLGGDDVEGTPVGGKAGDELGLSVLGSDFVGHPDDVGDALPFGGREGFAVGDSDGSLAEVAEEVGSLGERTTFLEEGGVGPEDFLEGEHGDGESLMWK